MDTFDLAKAKYEKNRERQHRSLPKVVPEKKEEVKPEKPKGMVVTVSGPVSLSFEIQHSGTLLASQMSEQSLRDLFIKQLSALGRVRCL